MKKLLTAILLLLFAFTLTQAKESNPQQKKYKDMKYLIKQNQLIKEEKDNIEKKNIEKEIAEEILPQKEKKEGKKFDIEKIDLYNISDEDIHSVNNLARIIKHKFDKQAVDWYILGLYRHIQNQLNSSNKYLLKAIKQDNKYRPSYILVGLNCQKLGEYQYVIEYMEIANSIKPSYKIFLTLGLAYKNINQPKRAINSYNSAIRLNPKSASTYNNIARLYQVTNHLDKAIDFYKKAIELDDENPIFYSNLGIVNSKLGNYDEAMKLYKKALEFGKDNTTNHNKSYCDSDDFKDSLKEIKTTIYNIPSSDYDRLLKLVD